MKLNKKRLELAILILKLILSLLELLREEYYGPAKAGNNEQPNTFLCITEENVRDNIIALNRQSFRKK